MSALLAVIVDTTALLKTVGFSFAASVGVTLAFSLAIFGVTRSAEAGRDQRTGVAVLAGLLAVAMLAVCAAALVLGFVVMTSK